MSLFDNSILSDIKSVTDTVFNDVKEAFTPDSSKKLHEGHTEADFKQLKADYDELSKKYAELVANLNATAEWKYNSEYEDYTCTACGNVERTRKKYCSGCGKTMVEKVTIKVSEQA